MNIIEWSISQFSYINLLADHHINLIVYCKLFQYTSQKLGLFIKTTE